MEEHTRLSSYLYNDDPEDDVKNILAFLDGVADKFGEISVSIPGIRQLCASIQNDFPYRDGRHQDASAFKKVANFILWFCQYSPVDSLPSSIVDLFPDDLQRVNNHQNVVIALLIGFDALVGVRIMRDNGRREIIINNRIQISPHSFCDIADAISGSTPQSGFKMLTVLLE